MLGESGKSPMGDKCWMVCGLALWRKPFTAFNQVLQKEHVVKVLRMWTHYE